MTNIIPFERFSARQRFRTEKVRGFGETPPNFCKPDDDADADAERKRFLVQHDLSRALDGQCAQRIRDINGMRSSPTREYDFQTPAEWLSTDDLVGLDNRINSAAYGLREIGQPAVADTLGGHYLPWKSKWDTLRCSAQRLNKKRGTLQTRDADALLDQAESLIAEIAEVIWLAADAANIKLYPHGVKR